MGDCRCRLRSNTLGIDGPSRPGMRRGFRFPEGSGHDIGNQTWRDCFFIRSSSHLPLAPNTFLRADEDRMLTVLLVRHGETVHNVAKLFAGITDSEYDRIYQAFH